MGGKEMKAGKETELYNQGYMDGFDDAQKAHIEPIKPKIKDVKEKSFPKDVPDYWTRLEHQYAGMAMQAMLTSPEILKVVTRSENLLTKGYAEKVAIVADKYAHSLVEKMKEERK
jgi:hypothetical protein